MSINANAHVQIVLSNDDDDVQLDIDFCLTKSMKQECIEVKSQTFFQVCLMYFSMINTKKNIWNVLTGN